MVTSLACSLMALAIFHQAPALNEPSNAEATQQVNSALGKGSFPWFDANKGAIKPLDLRREPDAPSRESPSPSTPFMNFFGNLIAMVGFAIAGALLIGLLIWLWRIYEPLGQEEAPRRHKKPGDPSLVAELPAEMAAYDLSDPWMEAIRRRDRGDLAGAVICLFAHQLLTLSKLGLVRLAPGRTGRQLLRSVTDSEFRSLVQPTLRYFESVYYGHHAPSADDFARVWERAEAFERRVADGVVT